MGSGMYKEVQACDIGISYMGSGMYEEVQACDF